MAVFDFHLHTYWSYDACTPPEYYFQRASELGLRAIAITEHHTMDSLAEVHEAAARYPQIGYIPAAELTVSSPLGTCDLVCLGLPAETPPELEAVFEHYRVWQRQTGDAMSESMTKAGFPYSREDRLQLLRIYRPERTIAKQGVTHVRNEIQRQYFVDRGYPASREAFPALMERLWKLAEFKPYPSFDTVIPIVKKYGGLVFIAHPLNYFNRDDEKRMDAMCEQFQLDGIECAHPMVPPELTAVYRAYCRRRGLLSSGGTDCHADPLHEHLKLSPGRTVAGHIGGPDWLEEILERLTPLQGGTY